MILTKLKEYAETQMNLPPKMYGISFIRWLVDVREDGSLEAFIPLGDNSKEGRRGTPMITPQVPAKGAGIKPRLLSDNGEYVLGVSRIKPKPSDPKKVGQRHQQFKKLISNCAEVTQNSLVQAVVIFLESWNPERDKGLLPSDFDSADIVTFRVSGVILADAKAQLHDLEEFWATRAISSSDSEKATEDSPTMTCLVTGQFLPVAQRLPVPIKGIPGKRPETALVSANQKPFTSYGLENSLTSPISYDAAELFAKALNHLISTPNTHRYIGSIVYVCWTCKQTDFDSLSFIDKPDSQAVKNLLESPFTAQPAHSLQAQQFYALALSASAARAVVRDWLETTIPNVQSSLRAWFAAQRIVDLYGEPGRPLSVYVLATSAYRDANKEMLPAVPTALVRVALYGGRLPDDLLARLVRRNRVERDITYPRAALIKLILTTQNQVAMAEMQTLNPNPNLEGKDRTAYDCGRLLAELESIQRAAIGKVNASLTDRYYGAASSNPASAFPPLMRGARAHLSKLRKIAPGTCNALEERIEDITLNLSDFPKMLTMHHQGLFALGYYHQRAANRAAAKAHQLTKGQTP